MRITPGAILGAGISTIFIGALVIACSGMPNFAAERVVTATPDQQGTITAAVNATNAAAAMRPVIVTATPDQQATTAAVVNASVAAQRQVVAPQAPAAPVVPAQPVMTLIQPPTPVPQPIVINTPVPPATATPVPAPTATPVPAPTSTPEPQRVQRLGVTNCRYRVACALPAAAEQGQILVAVGDINNSGRCHYRVFDAGQSVSGLGAGSFDIYRLMGPHDLLLQEADAIGTANAGGDPNGVCPKL